MALTGTEVLYVQAVLANGSPAASTEQTTTAAIAALAGTGTSPTFTNVTLTGLLYESAAGALTANATGTQAAGLALTKEVNRITTAANTSAPYSAVVLPAATAGLTIAVINKAANPIQVFPAGSDAIDGLTAAASVTQMQSSMVLFTCATAGAWDSEGLGTGYVGSFQTFSSIDSLTASGQTLAFAQSRFTTVAAGQSTYLPSAAVGISLTVINAGANPLSVYPATGQYINALSVNVSYVIPVGGVCEFFTTNTTTWHTVLSASSVTQQAYQTATNTSAFTATAANIISGSIETVLALTGVVSANTAITLPLVSALPAATPGQTYKLRVINVGGTGSGTWTVTTNTGWGTLNGTMTVAVGGWRDFIITQTSGSAATLQSIGTGTNS